MTERIFNPPSPCHERGGARPANEAVAEKAIKKTWDLDIFPNPASNQLNIVSKASDEELKIEIRDLTGRVMLTSEVKTKEFIAILDLDLINGAYFIIVRNGNNESTIKKLLISK